MDAIDLLVRQHREMEAAMKAVLDAASALALLRVRPVRDPDRRASCACNQTSFEQPAAAQGSGCLVVHLGWMGVEV